MLYDLLMYTPNRIGQTIVVDLYKSINTDNFGTVTKIYTSCIKALL